MTKTYLELTEDEFDEQYPLLENHINPNASWTIGDGNGCLFETYGEELNFLRQQDPRFIWTVIDADDCHPYVVSGVRFVNRIGYLVSLVPIPENTLIVVRLDPCNDDPEDNP